MALVLKSGKTYTATLGDAFGFVMSSGDFYGVIDRVEYDKKQRQCGWSVDVYASSASRTSGKAPMDRANFHFEGANFDSNIGSDGFTVTQAYTHSVGQDGFIHWESDE